MDSQLVLFSLAGLVVGAIVGLTGVGGGSLMTPILTVLFGIKPSVAVGTDLMFACITKGVGTVVHGWQSTVQWPAVKQLLCGSIPAALCTLYFLKALGNEHATFNVIISKAIGVCVLLTVLSLVFRKRLTQYLHTHSGYRLSMQGRCNALMLGGAVIGCLVTLSSIGAGAIGATLLVLVHPEWEPSEVAGTDIAYAVPLTLVAGAGHVLLGTVNWQMLAGLLLGSVPGISLGSYFAKSLPEQWLRGLLIGVLTLTGTKLLL